MNALKRGWFTEACEFWPGSCTSYNVDQVLHRGMTKFQNILILQTKYHGRALVLNDIVQYMETDTFSYCEMLAFLPLCNHQCPKKVLIVGGAGGGTAAQVLKHPDVEEVDWVGIDEILLEVCKQYFPETAGVVSDPKVSVFHEEVYGFLKRHEDQYDVIITDSSDPLKPADGSVRDVYFELTKKALQKGGMISMQAGSVWSASTYIESPHTPAYTLSRCRAIFENVAYAYVSVPSFESGQIGIVVAGSDTGADLTKPLHELSESFLEENYIQYYSPQVHMAAFVIPRCFQKLLGMIAPERPAGLAWSSGDNCSRSGIPETTPEPTAEPAPAASSDDKKAD